jgi:hypothetical protein
MEILIHAYEIKRRIYDDAYLDMYAAGVNLPELQNKRRVAELEKDSVLYKIGIYVITNKDKFVNVK